MLRGEATLVGPQPHSQTHWGWGFSGSCENLSGFHFQRPQGVIEGLHVGQHVGMCPKKNGTLKVVGFLFGPR